MLSFVIFIPGKREQVPVMMLKDVSAFKKTYCLVLHFRFVSDVLPPGKEDLKGDEVEIIIKFKNSLGIDDPDAAAMHMEVNNILFIIDVVHGD